jgi:hypothetical protein
MPLKHNAPPEYKTVSIAIRVTPSKKRYLEEHYGAMLPRLVSGYFDRLIANAVTGVMPKDFENIKDIIQD